MENQIIKGYKREKNVRISKQEAHKELMEDATSE